VFHLMTHAFFKALLFLAAGSVIIGMHHEQDIRHMGGLRKYMPITWITSLIGSIALIGIPGFSGFYSKDTIIEAVHLSHIPGAGFAYFAVAAGVFITAFYSFRMYFLVFHGAERFPTSTHHAAHVDTSAHDKEHDDEHAGDHGAHAGPPHETPWVVTVPLVLLAIPSVVIGAMTIGPMLFGDFFKGSIFVAESHNVLAEVGKEFHGAWAMALHGLTQLPFILAVAGVALAWFFYLKRPDLPDAIARKTSGLYKLLDNKYYFDQFNQWFFAGGARKLGTGLSEGGDRTLIDGWMVNGTAKLVEALGLERNDGVFFAAGKAGQAAKLAGVARTRIGEELGLIGDNEFRFCWIVDFPMYEYDEEAKKVDFSHNPFSMPQGELAALESKDPLDILAYQYDIVCNGVELSSGAIRNHSPDIMYKAFEIAGYSRAEVDTNFPGMINAFKYGAPPHGGSAPGIDRIVMLLAGEPNIREVVLFPMNQRAEDLMMNAPSEVSAKQLRELNIRIVEPSKS